jgi:hypothetical protein
LARTGKGRHSEGAKETACLLLNLALRTLSGNRKST